MKFSCFGLVDFRLAGFLLLCVFRWSCRHEIVPLLCGKLLYSRGQSIDTLTDNISLLCAGDDEQSDWFFEGDCGVGTGVAGLLPSWDSDSQLSLEDKRPAPTFLQPPRPSPRGLSGLGFFLSYSTEAQMFPCYHFAVQENDGSCTALLQGIPRASDDCPAPAPAASGGTGGGFPAR